MSEGNEEKPAVKRQILVRGANYLWEALWDVLGVKSAGEDIKEHSVSVERKGRFFAALATFLLLAVIGGCQLRGLYDTSKERSKDSLIQSNGVVMLAYQGQILSLDRKISDQIAEIANLKSDLNELKRENDAKISILTSERDSAQQRLSYFESIPANIVVLYSNLTALASNEPFNHRELNLALIDVKNLLIN